MIWSKIPHTPVYSVRKKYKQKGKYFQSKVSSLNKMSQGEAAWVRLLSSQEGTVWIHQAPHFRTDIRGSFQQMTYTHDWCPENLPPRQVLIGPMETSWSLLHSPVCPTLPQAALHNTSTPRFVTCNHIPFQGPFFPLLLQQRGPDDITQNLSCRRDVRVAFLVTVVLSCFPKTHLLPMETGERAVLGFLRGQSCQVSRDFKETSHPRGLCAVCFLIEGPNVRKSVPLSLGEMPLLGTISKILASQKFQIQSRST